MALQLHLIILPIITATLLIVGVALIVLFYRLRKDTGRWRSIGEKDWTHQGFAFSGWIIAGIGACCLLALAIALIPYQPKYWFLTQHEGTIATISNRFVEGSGDISGSTYTLTIEGDPTPRVVTDSRILGLEVGDRVDLTCSLEWVYGGSDRSNCYMRSFG